MTYAQFRFQLVADILAHGLKPIDVAHRLEEAADAFPEITLDECRRYRAMGELWEPWDSVLLAADGKLHQAHPWQDLTVRGKWKLDHRAFWRARHTPRTQEAASAEPTA